MIETTIPRIPASAEPRRVAELLRSGGARLTIADGPKVRAHVLAGHTGDSLCLLYRVEEPTIRAVADAPNGEVYKDSCVECFISFGVGYYNIETNCIGTPLVGFGIDRHRRRRLPASILGLIRTESTLGGTPFPEREAEEGWELAVVVPMRVFAYHPGKSLGGSLARANFYKCGDELAEPHYESWAPVRTATPDFHRPEFFAPLKLAE